MGIREYAAALNKIAESHVRLADAVSRLAEEHNKQLELLRDMASEQQVLAANQTTSQNNLQRLLEQMVNHFTRITE